MRHPALLAIALSFWLTLGCEAGSGPAGSGAPPPRDQAAGCTEDLDSHGLISLQIRGGFAGLEDYTMGITRDGVLVVLCPSHTRTEVPLPAASWQAVLSAREAAHLHELEPEYLGEGADGFEYLLSDDGCSPRIRIKTDDYAMPEQLAPLITLLTRIAFDAQPPFDEDCRRSAPVR